MNIRRDFDEFLKEGQETEEEFYRTFITFLMKRDKTERANYAHKRGNDEDGDVYITFVKENKNLLFEVKDDKMGRKSGNIVVEFIYKGKPSGIDATKSDYWAQKHEDSFYIISVEALRQSIKERKYLDIVRGGDYNESVMYRFKRDDFVDIVVDDMGEGKYSMIL